MESIGASERVMEYLDRDIAPQLSKGRTLPDFCGKVGDFCSNLLFPSTAILPACFRYTRVTAQASQHPPEVATCACRSFCMTSGSDIHPLAYTAGVCSLCRWK